MSAFTQLERRYKKMANLDHLTAICGWDQATMMPEGGNQPRADAMAELAVIRHEISTSPDLKELFAQAQDEELSFEERACLREMKRAWMQETVLPTELVERSSRLGMVCEHAWRTQRRENDWTGFAKNLVPVVECARERARLLAEASGKTAYDSLLDLYEPGMTSAVLDKLFADVKTWLPGMIDEAEKRQKEENYIPLKGSYPISQQKKLSQKAMELLRFDFRHGRLDVSVHPFCGGVPQDVRLTTCYHEDDFYSALMGVVHETGHALYEQGLPSKWAGLPVAQARSMGIHESQSLFYEMQIGRSTAFSKQISRMVLDVFGGERDHDLKRALSPENIGRWNAKVMRGFIRIDADELTYPAHIILRYEIERALIEGEIKVADIPELWDVKSQELLGISTGDNFRDGCMQDIHWTDGSFGYFPSYTLGAMYAAQFMAAMKKDLDVDACIERGDFAPINAWLKTHIWSHASYLSTEELVRQATGEGLNPKYFKEHLKSRYLGVIE